MKKQLKLIIFIIAALVVFGGFFLIKYLTADNNGNTNDDNKISLYSIKNEDITKLKINYDGGERTFAREDGSETWLYEGKPTFAVNSSSVNTVADVLKDISSTRIAEKSSSQLGEYGLEEPSCIVEITLKDGTSNIFNIGSYNSYNDEYYFTKGDENDVYMISKETAESFMKNDGDFILMDQLYTGEIDDIYKLRFDWNTGESSIEFDYYGTGITSNPIVEQTKPDSIYTDYYNWFVSVNNSNELKPADKERVTALLETVKRYQPDTYICYDGSTEYENPGYDFTWNEEGMVEEDYECKVTIGYVSGVDDDNNDICSEMIFYIGFTKGSNDDQRLVRRADSNQVNKICTNADNNIESEALFDIDAIHYLPSELCTLELSDVTEMKVSYKDTIYDISLNSSEDKYTVNDKSVDTEIFKDFFSRLTALKADSRTLLDVEGNNVTIEFKTGISGYENLKMILTEYEMDSYKVSFQNYDDLLINRTNVDKVLDILGTL